VCGCVHNRVVKGDMKVCGNIQVIGNFNSIKGSVTIGNPTGLLSSPNLTVNSQHNGSYDVSWNGLPSEIVPSLPVVLSGISGTWGGVPLTPMRVSINGNVLSFTKDSLIAPVSGSTFNLFALGGMVVYSV